MATILIVEDEPAVGDLLRQVFTRQGYRVITANGGREALELFQQDRPQTTLLDLHMPGMDGITVLKKIRAIDPQAAVMVLTGLLTDDLENQARELGVTDFLLKGDLSLDVLVGAVGRLRQQQSATLPETSVPFTDALAETAKEVLILVVDDEPQIRDILTQYLTLQGFRVRTARNGPETLQSVEQERPELIILDIYMPGMNGVEVLRQLRDKKNYMGGVIMLTASQDQALLKKAWALGSINVLGKPVDLARLSLVIHTALTFIGR
ncbi:MAG: response regulator [Nitrospirae bacterium]|nr:response regulator [Nitrospirota bacterium]